MRYTKKQEAAFEVAGITKFECSKPLGAQGGIAGFFKKQTAR